MKRVDAKSYPGDAFVMKTAIYADPLWICSAACLYGHNAILHDASFREVVVSPATESEALCPACTRSAGRREPSAYDRQAQVLRALANAARLQMIDRLSEHDCTVGELTELVGLDQSTVSKHLATLRHNGIVEGRRDGNHVFYRLLTPCVLDFFSCAARVMEERR